MNYYLYKNILAHPKKDFIVNIFSSVNNLVLESFNGSRLGINNELT